MECLPVATLPEGKEWSFEIKLDGFRLEAVKKKGEIMLFSRRGNILNRKFPYVATALKGLPDDTILDGEVVALDSEGRSDFNLLQNFRSAESKIHYYVFDILALKGKDISTLPLTERRKILAKTGEIQSRRQRAIGPAIEAAYPEGSGRPLLARARALQLFRFPLKSLNQHMLFS
jgi:ATP-dependent DNA ligase